MACKISKEEAIKLRKSYEEYFAEHKDVQDKIFLKFKPDIEMGYGVYVEDYALEISEKQEYDEWWQAVPIVDLLCAIYQKKECDWYEITDYSNDRHIGCFKTLESAAKCGLMAMSVAKANIKDVYDKCTKGNR